MNSVSSPARRKNAGRGSLSDEQQIDFLEEAGLERLLILATAGGIRSVGTGPRIDYRELAERVSSVALIDYADYPRGLPGRIIRNFETRLRSDVYLAAKGWSQRPRTGVVFAMSERVGIPLAWLRDVTSAGGIFVSMFQCWSPRQEFVTRIFRIFDRMDEVVVHCRSMKHRLIEVGANPDRVHIIHYGIDHRFFRRGPGRSLGDGILSLGEPRHRDYKSLFKAVEGLPVTVHLAASGHRYSREKGSAAPRGPANVKFWPNLYPGDLRSLYETVRMVVLPLKPQLYSAGCTSALEAASMGLPVIATRSQGLEDYILNGVTGILVDPGDPSAIKDAIEFLLSNPKEAARLGNNARSYVEEHRNQDRYVDGLSRVLRHAVARAVSGNSLKGNKLEPHRIVRPPSDS